MTAHLTEELEIRTLMREVRRYLAAVDTFRAEGREPHWAAEVTGDEQPRPRRRRAVRACRE